MTVHLVDPSGRRVARAGSRAAAHREARRGRHVGSHLQLVEENRASWGGRTVFPREFYVPAVGEKTIVVRPIVKEEVGGGGVGQDRVVGIPGKFVGKPIRVRPLVGGGLKIEGHYASKWSGEPVYETALGYGH